MACLFLAAEYRHRLMMKHPSHDADSVPCIDYIHLSGGAQPRTDLMIDFPLSLAIHECTDCLRTSVNLGKLGRTPWR